MTFTSKVKELFNLTDFYGKRGSEVLAVDNFNSNILFLSDDEIDRIFTGGTADLKIYKRMILDDTIESSFETLNQALLSLEWSINTKNATERKFCLEMINNLTYITFENVIENLQDARIYGVILAEKVQEMRNDKHTIKSIKFKATKDITDFKTDDFLNLTEILYSGKFGKEQKINGKELDNMLLYVYPYLKNGNFYGTSELKSIYREWRSKNILINLMNKALEKQGDPAMILFWDSSLKASENTLKDFAEGRNKSLMIETSKALDSKELYEKVKVQLIEPTMKNVEMFLKAIEYYSTAMRRKMGIPDDAGYTDTKFGSRSRAEEQLSLMYNNIVTKAKRTEALLNSQLFRPLIIENFPENENRPDWNIFQFNTSNEQITKEKAEVLAIMIDKGLINLKTLSPAGWEFISKFTGFDFIKDRMKEIAKEEKETTTEVIPPIKPDDPDTPEEPDTAAQRENITSEISELLKNSTIDTKLKNSILFQKIINVTNFNRIEDFLDIVEEDASARLQAQVMQIEDDYKNQLQPIWDKKNVNINRLKIKIHGDTIGRIKKIWNETLAKSYLGGKGEARSELKKKGLKFEALDKVENLNELYVADKTAIGLQAWIKSWQKRTGIKLTPAALKALKDIRDKAFTISGAFTKDIVNKAEKIIIGNIDRLSAGEIFKQVQEQVFDPLLTTPSRNGLSPNPYHLETTIRTNMSTYFNNARMNEFNDPEIADFVQAYEYSAIIDSETTDFCNGHNGEIIKANDPRLPNLTPPAHYNCRSLLVPITADEEYTAKWSNSYTKEVINKNTGEKQKVTIDIQQPAKGFGAV